MTGFARDTKMRAKLQRMGYAERRLSAESYNACDAPLVSDSASTTYIASVNNALSRRCAVEMRITFNGVVFTVRSEQDIHVLLAKLAGLPGVAA